MAHQAAKLILEHAGTFVDREEAIRTALKMGMPLHEIRDYLDWLDCVRQRRQPSPGTPSQTAPQTSRQSTHKPTSPPAQDAGPDPETGDQPEAGPEAEPGAGERRGPD